MSTARWTNSERAGAVRPCPATGTRTMQDHFPLAFQIPEAARRLGIGRSLLYELLKAGELRSFSIGTRRLVSDEALREFIAKREHREAA